MRVKVRGEKYKNKQRHKQTTTKHRLLDVITFQIVLYYAFGEINLYNLV